jgi:Fuc2NAc and GlcNAc transferase
MRTVEVVLMVSLALFLSALGTGVVRGLALSHGVLDIPNERSSHTSPTPRGGGASIVLVATLGLLVLLLLGRVHLAIALALMVGGIAVAGIGFVDDRRSVPASVRLAVHLSAALWATESIGGLPSVLLGDHLVYLGWVGHVLAVLGIVWVLNLFNFMDGIDGIAGTEAVFVLVSAGICGVITGRGPEISSIALLIGAASMGFLLWNWPPARIFMGDIGSGYLGYVIGVLALAATVENPAGVWVWLILGGSFFVDATVTLTRRLLRGERTYQAHRTHAYQWLARRWRSHKKVTVGVLAINVLWLLPCACVASVRPGLAGWMLLIALFPLVVIALLAGAGRPEIGTDSPRSVSSSPGTRDARL